MAAAAHPITPPPPLHPAPTPASLAVRPDPVERAGGASRAIDPESVVATLPVELEVAVPVRDFRVRSLLALEPGLVVASQWTHGEDLPLSAGDVQLAWTQFEVLVSTLAARITRFA